MLDELQLLPYTLQQVYVSHYPCRDSRFNITTTELHQFTSPKTAHSFLDSLLDTSSALKTGLDEVNLFSSYVWRSWAGIIKSKGLFP